MNHFTWIFLSVLGLTVALQLWLARRQIEHVRAHSGEVPAFFRERISHDAHHKAARYTVATTRLGQWETIYGAVLLLLWTLCGGLETLDSAWRNLGWGPIITGVAVILSVSLLMTLLELPFNAHRTFRIEQNFGFNRTDLRTFTMDLVKGALLTIAIGVPLIAVALWVMNTAGPWWWLWVWVLWFSFSLIIMWAYPVVIAPMFNRFEPLADEQLRQRIERLLSECGFKSNGIFVMDGSRRSSHGNAYFGGLGNNKRIVFFDTLLKSLDADEIEAVLAHELGHFRLHHVRKRLLAMGVLSLGGLALLGWLVEQSWFYQGVGVEHASNYMALVLFMLISPIFGFMFTPVFSWTSRRHEYQADEFAAKRRGSEALVQALVKLYRENASTLTPDPVYANFYYSHPPAAMRIDHLTARSA